MTKFLPTKYFTNLGFSFGMLKKGSGNGSIRHVKQPTQDEFYDQADHSIN
jgi:hypothetical protein